MGATPRERAPDRVIVYEDNNAGAGVQRWAPSERIDCRQEFEVVDPVGACVELIQRGAAGPCRS